MLFYIYEKASFIKEKVVSFSNTLSLDSWWLIFASLACMSMESVTKTGFNALLLEQRINVHTPFLPLYSFVCLYVILLYLKSSPQFPTPFKGDALSSLQISMLQNCIYIFLHFCLCCLALL